MNTSTNTNRNESITTLEIDMLTYREFANVLKVAGFSQADLARSIHRSRSHVNSVANGITPITLRHIQELERFLGSRLYHTALAIVKKQMAEATARRQEEHQRQEEALLRTREESERAEQARREQRLRELEEQLDYMEHSGDEHFAVNDIGPVTDIVSMSSDGATREGDEGEVE